MCAYGNQRATFSPEQALLPLHRLQGASSGCQAGLQAPCSAISFDPALNKHSPTSAPTLTGCEGSSHSRYLEPLEEVMRYKDRREHPDVFIVQCLVQCLVPPCVQTDLACRCNDHIRWGQPRPGQSGGRTLLRWSSSQTSLPCKKMRKYWPHKYRVFLNKQTLLLLGQGTLSSRDSYQGSFFSQDSPGGFYTRAASRLVISFSWTLSCCKSLLDVFNCFLSIYFKNGLYDFVSIKNSYIVFVKLFL